MSYYGENVGLRNVTVTDGVAVGTTPVALTGLSSGQHRSVIQVAALTQDIFLKFLPAGQAAPTISPTNYHQTYTSGDFSPMIGVSESITVWCWAASAGTVNVVELSY